MAQMGATADSGLSIGKWLDKYRVYVESSEDRDVLEKWFSDDLGEIHFLSADHGGLGGGGCTAVCNQVQASREAAIPAAGIVDRDKLFNDKHWDLLWQTDDIAFRDARPYGPDIHVLLRWELENYLLDPVALARVIADAKHGRQAPSQVDIENELLGHWECLIPIMAASVLLHERDMDSPGDGYGSTKSCEQISIELDQTLLPGKFGIHFVWQDAFNGYKQKLSAFDAPAVAAPERLESVLRIADGKRLIERVKVKHGLQHELRGYLSRAIKELALVPSELKNFLSARSSPTG
jgi:hypothetical protein